MPAITLVENSLSSNVTSHANTALSAAQELLSGLGFTSQRAAILAEEQTQYNAYLKLHNTIEQYQTTPNTKNQNKLIKALNKEITRLQKEYDYIKAKQANYQQALAAEQQSSSSNYIAQWRNWFVSSVKQFFGSDNAYQAERYTKMAEARKDQIEKLKIYRNEVKIKNKVKQSKLNASEENIIELNTDEGIRIPKDELSPMSRRLLAMPATDEFPVNTYNISAQGEPVTTTLNNGNFVVVWKSNLQDGTAESVYGQRFTSAGVKSGDEFLVNTDYTAGSQYQQSIASLTNGGFIVTWMSDNSHDGVGSGIFGQRFTAGGGKSGSEFLINTYTLGNQMYSSVAGLVNGNFTVAWVSNDGQDGSGSGVYGQVFKIMPTGVAKLGSEFPVNTYTSGSQLYPSVAGLANGNFVVTWNGEGSTDSVGVYGQLFTADGLKIDGQFLVNSRTNDDQVASSVASLTNGNFVVVWSSNLQDGSSYGIYGQLFTVDGAKLYGEFPINSYTSGSQSEPAVSKLANGGFVVTWHSSSQDGSGNGVYGQVFTSDGVKKGDEFLVNSYTNSEQRYPSVTANLVNGKFFIVWESNLQDGSSYGVYGRLFNANDPPVLSGAGGNFTFTENDPAPAVDPSLTVVDTDDLNLASAAVSISNGFISGEDILSCTTPLPSGINSCTQSGNTLTLSGSASVADYQTALQSVTYQDVSGNPSTATRAVAFQVNDGNANNNLSNVVTRNILVAVINTAPTLLGVNGSFTFTENDPAMIIASALAIRDPDNSNLVSATVSINSGFVNSEDILSCTTPLPSGISSCTQSGNTLTLSGLASKTNYQAVLQGVTYQDVSSNPSTSTRTIAFQVNDGAANNNLSNVVTRNILITAINNAPVLSGAGGSITFAENDSPLAIDLTLNITDVDNSNLASATVAFSNGFVNSEDELICPTPLPNGINSCGQSVNTLTLSGSASVTNYQTALRNVKYKNGSSNPTTATRTIAFQVDDGGTTNKLSNVVSRDIMVVAVNNAPELSGAGGSFTFIANDPATIIDSILAIRDLDNSNLVGATVSINSGFASGEDKLNCTTPLPSGITTCIQSNNRLILNGLSSVANYQTALRGVKYQDISSNPLTTTRAVAFQVNDGEAINNLSNMVIRNILVKTSDDPGQRTGSQGGLSSDEKIAIGVGVGVGVPALLLTILGVYRYLKPKEVQVPAQQNAAQPPPSTSRGSNVNISGVHGNVAISVNPQPAEIPLGSIDKKYTDSAANSSTSCDKKDEKVSSPKNVNSPIEVNIDGEAEVDSALFAGKEFAVNVGGKSTVHRVTVAAGALQFGSEAIEAHPKAASAANILRSSPIFSNNSNTAITDGNRIGAGMGTSQQTVAASANNVMSTIMPTATPAQPPALR